MDIPKDKYYPEDSVQCDKCGGHGCPTCYDRGWLIPKTNSGGRKCANPDCRKPLPPPHIAIYCSNTCAMDCA